MIVWSGEVYIDKAHIDALKDEAEYIKRRYYAVASKQNRHPSLVKFVRLQTTQTK